MATSTRPPQGVTPTVTVTSARRKFTANPIVTLIVGESKGHFHVHQEQLFEVSSFFKTAFTSAFPEGSEKRMDLEEEEDIFDLFIQWLYSQQYEMPGNDSEGGRFMEPLKLFALAEKFDVGKLKSHLMVKMFAAGKEGGPPPSLTAMAYTYQHTPANSCVRKLLADWYAWNAPVWWYKDPSIHSWFRGNPEVATDVMLSLINITPRQQLDNPFNGDMPEEYKERISG